MQIVDITKEMSDNEDCSNLTAVVTDVHYRMSLALIRTLGEKGVKVVCCEYKKEKYPLGFYSKFCSKKCEMGDSEALEGIYRICEEIYQREGKKPILFPVGAKTLLKLSHIDERQRFQNVACLFIPSREQLNQFNDKKVVAEIGNKSEIPVPMEYCAPYADIKFPCIVKPACGEKFGLSAAKRYCIVNNHQELNKSCEKFKNITGEEPIVQQYLSGAGAGCSVLCKDGEVVSAICHMRSREYPVTGGPSTCCRAFYSDELVNYAQKITKFVGYNGIAMIEFKYDEFGKPHLLEINPRIWGTFPLVRVASSDFIDKWINLSISSRDFEPANLNYKETKMIYGFSDLIAGIAYAKRGKIRNMFEAVMDFFNPFVADGLWEWSDLKPAMIYLMSVLRRRK